MTIELSGRQADLLMEAMDALVDDLAWADEDERAVLRIVRQKLEAGE